MKTDYPLVSYRGRALPLPDAIMQTRINPLTGKLYEKPSSMQTRFLAGLLRRTSNVERTFKAVALARVQHYITGTYLYVKDAEVRQLVHDIVNGLDITSAMHGIDAKIPRRALDRDQVAEQLAFFREYFVHKDVDVLSLNR